MPKAKTPLPICNHTDAAEILKCVDEQILTSPERWTKGVLARSRKDKRAPRLSVGSPRAQSFCLIGAISRCALPGYIGGVCARDAVEDAAKKLYGFKFLPGFNDSPHTKFSDVKKVLKAARESLAGGSR